MKTSLSDSTIRAALGNLVEASTAFARRYPGETGRRQPVHTVYGGAHLFHAGLARRLGEVALKTMAEYAPDAFTFARAVGLPAAQSLPKSGKQATATERRFAKFPEKLRHENRPAWLALTVYAGVLEKLQREPVEDFRIDFEDGYGNRPDAEEDQHAKLAAEEFSSGEKLLPGTGKSAWRALFEAAREFVRPADAVTAVVGDAGQCRADLDRLGRAIVDVTPEF